jgi:ribosomal-protein-alanine N-acetyltransferase
MSLRVATAAAAADLAAIHAATFDEPWGADEIRTLLSGPGGFGLLTDGGFILCRAIAGEAEILTLAVKPDARRQGLGRTLVEAAAIVAAQGGAEAFFLEVASDNAAAIALYDAAGFERAGARRGYYQRPDGPVDALVMRRALNRDG